jgi:hypothetical protein
LEADEEIGILVNTENLSVFQNVFIRFDLMWGWSLLLSSEVVNSVLTKTNFETLIALPCIEDAKKSVKVWCKNFTTAENIMHFEICPQIFLRMFVYFFLFDLFVLCWLWFVLFCFIIFLFSV